MSIQKVQQYGWQDDNNLRVQWLLGTQCSLKCDYCPEYFNNGQQQWPTLETITNFVQQLSNHYGKRNRLINFSLVGGEVTECPSILKIFELFEHNNIRAEIMTNGNKPMSFWEQAATALFQVVISFHYKKVNEYHIRSVISILEKYNVQTHLHFMMIPDCFDEILEIKNRFKQYRKDNTYQFKIQLRPLFKDFGYNQNLYNYTNKQLELIKTHDGELDFPFEIESSDGNVENSSAITHTIQKDHNYKGLYCNIGIEQIVVDPDGYVWRGWCWTGGNLGNVNGTINFPTEPVICPKSFCKNGMDQLATKTSYLP